MAENKNQAKSKLRTAVLLRTLLPMLVMGIIIAMSAMSVYENGIKKEVEKSLLSIANSVKGSFDIMYPGEYYLKGTNYVSLYKGEYELTGDNFFIDSISRESGMDITLFFGNTRVLTTLVDDNGARYIQTGLHNALYNEVVSSGEAVYADVVIGTDEYKACYLPIYNEGMDEPVCIIGVAKKSSEIHGAATKVAVPVWIITLIGMACAGLISVNYTGKLTKAIDGIAKFIGGMIKGELNNEMPREITRRKDELGSAAKSIVEMQSTMIILVERDPLTQLYNRRYGGAKLRKIQAMSDKNGVPFSVAMGDIDFFKKVNDTYGHEAGDIVLKKVAETMRKFMAGKGFVVRWGGEEFVLIFDKMGADDAYVKLCELLDKIREIEILYDSRLIKVTMTFGVVDGSISPNYADLLRLADERLYNGKQGGRNRVVYGDEPAEQPNEAAPSKEEGKNATVEEVKEQILRDDFLEQLIEKMTTKIVDAALLEDEDEE